MPLSKTTLYRGSHWKVTAAPTMSGMEEFSRRGAGFAELEEAVISAHPASLREIYSRSSSY